MISTHSSLAPLLRGKNGGEMRQDSLLVTRDLQNMQKVAIEDGLQLLQVLVHSTSTQD